MYWYYQPKNNGIEVMITSRKLSDFAFGFYLTLRAFAIHLFIVTILVGTFCRAEFEEDMRIVSESIKKE